MVDIWGVVEWSSVFLRCQELGFVWVHLGVPCLGLSSRGGEETATTGAQKPLMHLNPPFAIHAWSPEESKWRHRWVHVPRILELVLSYSKVRASSIAGICENASKSSEFQFSVLMIGWLCKMSNLACWKQGHSFSRWSKVSGSSSQNLHSSETSSG